MDIDPGKTKVMTNNPNGFQRGIKVKGQRLEGVENFKYLGAVVSNEGSGPEILPRMGRAAAALSGLKVVWGHGGVSLASGVGLMRTLVCLPLCLRGLDLGSGGRGRDPGP